MNVQLQRERLARKDILASLWAELEAEEERAKKSKKSPDWRRILRTKAMREEAPAKSNR